jgi:hypothetical protein
MNTCYNQYHGCLSLGFLTMLSQLQWLYSIKREDDLCVNDVDVSVQLLSRHLSGRTKKPTLNLSENWSPGWDLNLLNMKEECTAWFEHIHVPACEHIHTGTKSPHSDLVHFN